MKRYIGFLLCVVLIVGCGRRANVVVLENDAKWYTVAIREPVSPPYPLEQDFVDTYIDTSVQTIREDIEKQLEAAGYSKELASRVEIEGDGYDTQVLRIVLPLQSSTPDEAREVGIIATALVKTFYEEYADTILYELNVFNERPSATQISRTVICGNTEFEYAISWKSLYIEPYDIPSSPTTYTPVKPN